MPGIDERCGNYRRVSNHNIGTAVLLEVTPTKVDYIQGIIDETSHDLSYCAETERRGRGCPHFSTVRDQLDYLVSLSFNWSEIASLFGVSRMTIYRYTYM